jgi:hypothetical protein
MLTGFHPYANSEITPLGLGYLNAILRSNGYESEIRLFPEAELFTLDTMHLLLKNFNNIKLRYSEVLEVPLSLLFGEKLGFVEGSNQIDLREKRLKLLFSKFKRISEELSNSDVVGFSILCPDSIGPTFYLSKLLKEENKDIKIILGGPIVDVFKWILTSQLTFYKNLRRVLEKEKKFIFFKKFLLENVDFLVHGEGEKTLLEIVTRLDKDKPTLHIPGTTFLNGHKFYFNGERDLLNLNSLPYPDFTGLDLSEYMRLGFHLSRGCPAMCRFCDERIFWKCFRIRDVDEVVKELKTQIARYNKRHFYACESLINGDPILLKKFCKELVKSNTTIDWVGNLRFQETDKILLDNLKKSGLTRASFGLETGVQEVLDSMRKNQNLAHAVKVLKYAKKIELIADVYIILSYPGMTFKKEFKVFQKIRGLKKYFRMISLDVADVRMRSELISNPEKNGFKILHSKATLDEKIWNSYSITRSYVPGFFTFVRSALGRKEINILCESYRKLNLSNLSFFGYTYSKFFPRKLKDKFRLWFYRTFNIS